MPTKPTPPFRTYVARQDFTVHLVVGAPKLSIRAGDLVEFDGTSVRLGPGRTAAAPTLSAAIAIGWLSPVDGG